MLSFAVDLSVRVPPQLTCSIIHVLSGWMPSTVNQSPENAIYGLPEPEFLGQQANYGLMQFSGLQARQNDYKGAFNDLFDAELNIKVGTSILELYVKTSSRVESALLLYLGRGRNYFIPQILGFLPHYEKLISERPVNLTK